ncbi:hypothetical protein [Nocardia stercoris]|nr:hypothetical protein [Nocardia stercoris]
MTGIEFIEPDEVEFLNTFGAEKSAIPGEESAFRFDIEGVGDDGKVQLSYDAVGRSAQVIWLRRDREMARIYRENIHQISVDPSGAIRIENDSSDISSVLIVEIYPAVRITDTQLLC